MRYFLHIFFLFLALQNTNAQNKLSVEHFSIEDGLANNSIRAMFQDQQGYLWFGTLNGLSRYDGQQFKTFDYNHSDSTSISNNKIREIFQDRLGYIWVTTYDDHVHRFDPKTETFMNFPSAFGNDCAECSIRFIYESSPGIVWMYLNDNGCVRVISTSDSSTYETTWFNSLTGLVGNELNTIWADSKGGLWIGATNGVTYFSNDKISIEDSKKALSILNVQEESVVAFCETDKTIWAGTQSGKIFRLRNQTAELFEQMPTTSNQVPVIRNMQVIGKNTILVASENGLLLIEGGGGKKQYFAQENSGLNSNFITSFYQDQSGDCWLVTDQRGVTRFQLQNHQFTHYPLNPQVRQSILEGEKQIFLEDQNGDLWVGIYGGGISRFNRKSETFDQFLHEENNPASLSSNLILSAFEDRSGNLWVGTYKRGVNKVNLQETNFHNLSSDSVADRDFSNEVRGIFEDSRQWIWTGNKRGEIVVYNQDFVELFRPNKTIQNLQISSGVYAFEEDQQHNIWIGTKGDGIFVLRNLPSVFSDAAVRKVKIGRFTTNSGLSYNDVFNLHEDRFGQMWVALYHGGVNVIRSSFQKDQEILHYLENENDRFSISDDRTRCFMEDVDGNMWIGTANGLNFLSAQYLQSDNKKFWQVERTNEMASLSYNDVICIYQDSNENIWIGTYGGGINRLMKKDSVGRPFSFVYVQEKDGLSSNSILSIVEDKSGHLWCGTDFGLSKYQPDSHRFDNFYIADGLTENSFSEGPAILTTAGNLTFGHISGMVWFDPDSVQKSQQQVPVVLTNMLVNGEVDRKKLIAACEFWGDSVQSLELKYNENFLTFEFAALDFKAPSNVQYSFKLENYEQNWNQVGNLNSAIYRELQPGDYQFRVRASNSDGLWVNPEMTLNLTIAPPPWKTVWAYAIYFLVALSLFFLIRRIVLERIRLKHEVEFEKQLADDKLKFYTSISHEFKTPLALILGPVEDLLNAKNLSVGVEKPLKMVRRNTHRLLELIDQLMDFRKIQKGFFKPNRTAGNIVTFLQEIFDAFKPLAERKKIDFYFKHEIAACELMLDFKSLEKVVFNLLSNAFKHTESEQEITLELNISEEKQQLLIAVSDQGEGIREQELLHIFERFNLGNRTSHWKEDSSTGIGLSLTKELVEMQGGVVSVESRVGVGSRFCVKLPFIKADKHLNEALNEHPDLNFTKKFVDVVEEEERQEAQPETKSLTSKATILVVEDNPDLQVYLTNKLVANYKVLQAENGKIGLELAKKEDPDLIVCDVMMPEMDGIELTKQLKNEFHTSHIPIILLTAKSLDEHKLEGIEIGADDYITKPFSMVYVEKRIQNILRQRKQLKERFGRDMQSNTGELAKSKADQEFLNKVVQLVEENLSDSNFSIDNLLEYFNYGRTVFYKKMKGISGYSPKDFLRIVRMKKAGILLQNPDVTVSEVAFDVGFNDANYFSRLFKKHFGENPSEYQKKHLR